LYRRRGTSLAPVVGDTGALQLGTALLRGKTDEGACTVGEARALLQLLATQEPYNWGQHCYGARQTKAL
jgi:hypothetical protein